MMYFLQTINVHICTSCQSISTTSTPPLQHQQPHTSNSESRATAVIPTSEDDAELKIQVAGDNSATDCAMEYDFNPDIPAHECQIVPLAPAKDDSATESDSDPEI